MKKVFNLPLGYTLTIWWWTKEDKRQKKPTKGFGLILERA